MNKEIRCLGDDATDEEIKRRMRSAKNNLYIQKNKIESGLPCRVNLPFLESVVDKYTKMHLFRGRKGISFEDIPGFEGWYQASKCGKIFSIWSCRILRLSKDKEGYLLVGLHRTKQKVHRLIATTFIPNPEKKPQVNHLDFDKTNNHVDNLAWATSKEDADHKVFHNKQAKGDSFPTRKGVSINRKSKLTK